MFSFLFSHVAVERRGGGSNFLTGNLAGDVFIYVLFT